MKDSGTDRRGSIDLLIVQTLGTGLTLPILSLFSIEAGPPWFGLRVRPIDTPAASLGIPFPEDVVLPATRQLEGLSVLSGTALALAMLTLLVTCATVATLVRRAGLARRAELGIRAAVGASRRDLGRLVMGPLFRRLALGALAGSALGLALAVAVRRLAPEALATAPGVFSLPVLLAILAPAAAACVGARLDLRAVLRRFASPLTLESTSRLAPLGLGGAYFGVVAGLLVATGTLAGSRSYADLAPAEWAEARDTLLFEVDATGAGATMGALAAARALGDDRAWHLVSAGALEGLGPAAQETSECGCPIGNIISPYTRLWAQRHSVTPGAFAALGVPVVRGREFTADDHEGAEGVAIIDANHLRAYPGVDPVGKHLLMGGRGLDQTWYRIVGIVNVPKPLDLATAGRPIPGVYLSALQHPPSHGQLVTRREGGGEAEVVAAGLPVRPLGTLADRLAMWAEPLAWFAGLVGLAALGAFVVGVYGVATLTWLNVRARTPELGVRRAVGARGRDVRRLVFREVLETAAVGAAFGAILGRGLAAGLADRFRAVEGLDAGALAVVVATLGLAAALSAVSPARRAARIEPIEAIGDDR